MNRTEWEAEVKKALTLRSETLKDLANGLNWSYGYARQIASGDKNYQSAINKMSEYLGIYPYQVKEDD